MLDVLSLVLMNQHSKPLLKSALKKKEIFMQYLICQLKKSKYLIWLLKCVRWVDKAMCKLHQHFKDTSCDHFFFLPHVICKVYWRVHRSNSLFLWAELWKGLADFLGYLTHKLSPTACTFIFTNIFSLMSRSTIRGNMTNFPNPWQFHFPKIPENDFIIESACG